MGGFTLFLNQLYLRSPQTSDDSINQAITTEEKIAADLPLARLYMVFETNDYSAGGPFSALQPQTTSFSSRSSFSLSTSVSGGGKEALPLEAAEGFGMPFGVPAVGLQRSHVRRVAVDSDVVA